MVLGKKDITSMNSFATITEEKEEDISSDGSNAGNINHRRMTAVQNKKIIFPKPRKYITSRVADRREEEAQQTATVKESTNIGDKTPVNFDEFTYDGQKMNLADVRQLIKGGTFTKSEVGLNRQEVQTNYFLPELSLNKSWKEIINQPPLTGWPKPTSKSDFSMLSDDKKKMSAPAPENSSSVPKSAEVKAESRSSKKSAKSDRLSSSKSAGLGKVLQESLANTKVAKLSGTGKEAPKGKSEKDKALNMRDVVNVYKNLTYGSKDEIKSFVENLSFIKDEVKAANDKNLLSVMNLKALENKIKDLGKNSGNSDENQPQEIKKKVKAGKGGKKTKKLNIERLARHKVVKIPATLDYTYSPDSRCLSYGSSQVDTPSTDKDHLVARRSKQQKADDKVPWRYVGTQSALDKAYFVYPSYPSPSVTRKTVKKVKKVEGNKTETVPKKGKKSKSEVANPKTVSPKAGPKVKASVELIRGNLSCKGIPGDFRSSSSRSLNDIKLSGSFSSKSFNRSSATTICTVEFQPSSKTIQLSEQEPTDPSFLFYLHGKKAIHVNSPYLDKQFSRVKFLRKEGARMPLIKGIYRTNSNEFRETVSVKNITLPESLSRVRFVDLLDFEEDIQNINKFLLSQNQEQPEPRPEVRKNPREKSDNGIQYLHHHQDQPHPQDHQHGTHKESLSPDVIIHEISHDINQFQNLPDTKENRRMIADFFDHLDQRIEASKAQELISKASKHYGRMIPIVGY